MYPGCSENKRNCPLSRFAGCVYCGPYRRKHGWGICCRAIIHFHGRESVRIIDKAADLIQYHQAAAIVGASHGCMVVDHPCIFIEADHGHVGHDAAIFLVEEMAGDAGTQVIKFFISTFDFIFIISDELIFLGVDKTGLKEKIP